MENEGLIRSFPPPPAFVSPVASSPWGEAHPTVSGHCCWATMVLGREGCHIWPFWGSQAGSPQWFGRVSKLASVASTGNRTHDPMSVETELPKHSKQVCRTLLLILNSNVYQVTKGKAYLDPSAKHKLCYLRYYPYWYDKYNVIHLWLCFVPSFHEIQRNSVDLRFFWCRLQSGWFVG